MERKINSLASDCTHFRGKLFCRPSTLSWAPQAVAEGVSAAHWDPSRIHHYISARVVAEVQLE